jgi:hypothetical protein
MVRAFTTAEASCMFYTGSVTKLSLADILVVAELPGQDMVCVIRNKVVGARAHV